MTAGFRNALGAIVGHGHVLTRPIDLAAYASDASVYRVVPQAVVQAGVG